MKNILIGGCSFSCSQKGMVEPLWTPWTDILYDNYNEKVNIINTSHTSLGQSKITEKILNELINYDYDVDFVIIQWSAIGRSYSTSINEFYERILIEKQIGLLPYLEEYMLNSETRDWVTNKFNIIDKSFYLHSLSQIYLIKSLLDSKKIPYMMFWGWEQINSEIKNEYVKIFDYLYDENFWLHNENGGMVEFCQDNLMDTQITIPNDFHPTTESHIFFYEQIIKPKVTRIFGF